LYASLAPPAPL